MRVALLERYGTTNTKSNEAGEVADIIPIYSEDGCIVMYAVNFKGGGYTIVSATKKYYPILAKVENGSFSNETFNMGASILIDEYIESIKYSSNLPYDSLKSVRGWWKNMRNHAH